ncbi:MAG: hypothetical protein AAGI66_10100 [Cyanobacteria bacterium P01_H01_bin.74]
MTTVRFNRLRKDQFWKSAIERFFKPMMEYIYGDKVKHYDLDNPEFLDKEMASIRPESETKDRVADKLVRMTDTQGREIWVLFHIEVQGKSDPEFDIRT